jgi:hypothetical protein
VGGPVSGRILDQSLVLIRRRGARRRFSADNPGIILSLLLLLVTASWLQNPFGRQMAGAENLDPTHTSAAGLRWRETLQRDGAGRQGSLVQTGRAG